LILAFSSNVAPVSSTDSRPPGAPEQRRLFRPAFVLERLEPTTSIPRPTAPRELPELAGVQRGDEETAHLRIVRRAKMSPSTSRCFA